MKEKWKTLIYCGVTYNTYEISNIGNVRRKDTCKILKKRKSSGNAKNRTPFYCVGISLGARNSRKVIYIHRAMAETFIDNPNLYKFVIFRDGDYENLSVDNLYWSEHLKGDDHFQLQLEKRRKRNSNCKAVSKRRRKIKEIALEYKGGKCCICGYNKCVRALEFHHLNPEEKDFSISSDGCCRSFDSIKKELDKCICVCSNCHREIHDGLIDVDMYKAHITY